jgi:hypothetical protein
MSQLGMNSALWGVYTSTANADALTTTPESYLNGFDLTDEERLAIAEQDYAALLMLGAHPFLMFKMAFRLAGGFSHEFVNGYVGALSGLELRDIVT